MPFLAAIPIGAAIAGAAGIGAAGSLAAGAMQSGAANNAAGLQYQESQNALNFQQQQYANQQQQLAPYLQTGRAGLSELGNLLGVPGAYSGGGALPGSAATSTTPNYSGAPGMISVPRAGAPGLNNPRLNSNLIQNGWQTAQAPPGYAGANGPRSGVAMGNQNTHQPQPPGPNGLPSSLGSLGATGSLLAPFSQQFQAPTLAQAEQYPGYQFQLGQGQNAIENSAAARGGLVSGNEATALNNYSQGAAQSDYNNVYNEAMQQYLNSYNIYNENQANTYNRLASLAGLGQTSTQQLGNAGQGAANNVSNISLGAGSQIGQSIQNAGAATASGYLGASNAGVGALGNLSQLAAYQQAGIFGQGNQIPQDFGGGAADYYSQIPGAFS